MEQESIELIQSLINHPHGVVCKHYSALTVLSWLEQNNLVRRDTSAQLAKLLVDADDEGVMDFELGRDRVI